MKVATSRKTRETELAAAVFALVTPEDFYEAVLDVRGFPAWAPGVRRVGVLSGEGGAGMLSEWEVSFLGFGKTVRSMLEEAENQPVPAALDVRWTGRGLGRVLHRARRGVHPDLVPDRARRLTRCWHLWRKARRHAARTHLKRSLSRLGRLVAGDDARVLVGPIVEHLQPGA